MPSTIDIDSKLAEEYRYGFVSDIESETIPRGLNEDIVRMISAKKDEPEWLLEYRLKAFRFWKEQPEPTWANVSYPPIDYENLYYYSAPKKNTDGPKSLNDVDAERIRLAGCGIGGTAQAVVAAFLSEIAAH